MLISETNMNCLWQEVSFKHISDIRLTGYKTSLGISRVDSYITVHRLGRGRKIGPDHILLYSGKKT